MSTYAERMERRRQEAEAERLREEQGPVSPSPQPKSEVEKTFGGFMRNLGADIKDVAYGLVIIGIFGSFWYVFDDWHYKPLRESEKVIKEKNEVISIYEVKINDLVDDIDTCEQETKRGKIHGIIKGIKSNDNNKTIVIDYNNTPY